MTKYFFSILEIGYCSHMMYRAKYMLVSLHLCTLPFSPTFPFPVGNKWPFCNCILLSWVLIICALGWYFFCKLKNHGDLHKTITNSYNMDIFCFVFLLGENYLSISYRIHLEVLWKCFVRRKPSWGTCVTTSVYEMECYVPFCRFLPWLIVGVYAEMKLLILGPGTGWTEASCCTLGMYHKYEATARS